MIQPTRLFSGPQFDTLRDDLGHHEGLPFLEVLSRPLVEQVCRRGNHAFRDRVYTPWVTLGIFLSQILSEDQSCDDAVEHFQKFRYDQGLPAVASKTTSYCEARQRLPEELLWDLAHRTGHTVQHQAPDTWLFHGRVVKIVDGTTVLMPDTPENQAAYPQPNSQAPGLGFPIARLLVVFSLAVGTVLEAVMGPYQGKQTGEQALLRQLFERFQPGEIVVADRFHCSYWAIAAFVARGVDVVLRLHQARVADFRRGRRLGRFDHLVTWTKPRHVPDWMSRAEYDAMPETLTLREFRVRVRDRTKRVHELVIVTTLVDPARYPASELGDLFRQRLGCRIRFAIAQDSDAHGDVADQDSGDGPQGGGGPSAGVQPDPGPHGGGGAGRVGDASDAQLRGARHTIRSFEESHLYDPTWIEADLPRLLELIGQKRLVDRPNRYEPRAVKQRPKPYPRLSMPRKVAQRLIRRGIKLYEKK